MSALRRVNWTLADGDEESPADHDDAWDGLGIACPQLHEIIYQGIGGVMDMTQLAAFPRLKVLQLSWIDDLSGLDTVGMHCPLLERLVSSQANLNAATLAGLRPCTALRHLLLDCTRGLLDVNALSACPLLEYLDLQDTGVEDLSALAGCPRLRHLDLLSSKVTSIAALQGCKRLEFLNVCFTKVTDMSPLRGCAGLKYFMSDAPAWESTDELAYCPNLRTLRLVECYRMARIASLSACPLLDTLLLSQTAVADLSALAHCPHLRILELDDTNVEDVRVLAHCTELVEVHLASTRVRCVDALAACPRLGVLRLKDTPVESLDALVGRCRALQVLDVQGGGVAVVPAGLLVLSQYWRQTELYRKQRCDEGGGRDLVMACVGRLGG